MSIQIIESSSEVLPKEARSFLERINQEAADVENDPGIPVYLRKGDNFLFLRDYILKSSANKTFEKEALPYSLYRGAAIVIVYCLLKYDLNGEDIEETAILLVPDERKHYRWFKGIAGLANHSEGMNLLETGRRELGEETFFFTLAIGNHQRLVPRGMKNAPFINALNIDIKGVIECGELLFKTYQVVDELCALEAILQWNLQYPESYSYVQNEDWFEGGHAGIVACLFDPETKEFLGVFSGQQGFIPLLHFPFYQSVEEHMKKI